VADSNGKLEIYDPTALVKAVRVLADTCDGAQGKDFVGFNRADSRYGTMLALAPASSWTNSVCYEAWMMLAKYKNQLLLNNINYDEIAPPLRPLNFNNGFDKGNIKLVNQAKNSVSTNGELFIIRCEYDEQLIEQIRTVPGIFWNTQALVWIAPLSSEQEIIKLIRNYGFSASEGINIMGITTSPIASDNKKITISKSGRLIFDFEYQPEIVAEIKKIPGRLWDAKKKFWSVPPVISGVEIAEKYGFSIPPQIRAAIMDSAKREADLLEKSASVDSDIEVQNLSGTLMPYQKAGVAYATSVGRCLIADQMGLGKTVEAIATLELRDAFPAIIVCPASLKENWRRELNKWLPHRVVNIVSGKTDIVNTDVNIVNYDILYKFVDAIKHLGLSGLVLDESHYVKNGSSKRTKAAKDIASKVPKSGSLLLLSGTPVTNRPSELVSQLEIMGMLSRFGGKWAFLKRYTAAYHNGFGWDTNGASNLIELNTKLRQNCYIRRTKDEVLKELPEKSRNIVHLEPSGKGQKEYISAEDDLVLFLRENGYKSKDSSEHMARTQVLKRLAAWAKMDSVEEWIDSFLESCDRKLVVFAHNVDVVDHLAGKYGGLRVSGRDSLEERQHAVDSFQTDPKSRVIVLNLQAGGVGITLTAGSDVVFVQMGWTPGEHDQAEDRCHRIGQKNNVQVWYLLASGTIDEDIYHLVDSKRSVVDAVTEGDEVEHQSLVKDLMNRILAKKND
jgi:superfamily II DNA or RNA helicase